MHENKISGKSPKGEFLFFIFNYIYRIYENMILFIKFTSRKMSMWYWYYGKILDSAKNETRIARNFWFQVYMPWQKYQSESRFKMS